MTDPESLLELQPDEISSMNRRMISSYKMMLAYYRFKQQLPIDEADENAREIEDLDSLKNKVLQGEIENITWWDLSRLAEYDEEAAREAWARIIHSAKIELSQGDRAASVIEGVFNEPFERARYLAIRAELERGLRPISGLERPLLDMLAHDYLAWLYWTEISTVRTQATAAEATESVNFNGSWPQPLVSESKALEQAILMADRFKRSYIRCLRALRDLRRYSANITINQANQVNIGRQQINSADQDRKGRLEK